ncbi:MAG: flagellar hook-length control protein FliK [Planctomycetes bacterium]|nr:flagellar hook-length control protein FliK [Planctomycetota bacterium]
MANDLNGAAESRTIHPHGVVPLPGTTAAPVALADKPPVVPGAVSDTGRSGGVARQVADALLGRAGSASGRAGASARAASPVAPPAESPTGTKAGHSAQRAGTGGQATSGTRRLPHDTEEESTGKPAFRKLLKSIHLSTGTRKSTARMLLNPPELGRMRVDVRLEDQRLYIEIRTERHQARELLAKNVQELRQSLERHGVRVEQFELRTGMNDEARHWWTSHQWHPAFESDRQPPLRRTRHDPDSVDRQRSALDHPTEEDESSDVRGAASPRPVAGDRRLDVRV